jgi:hypothetical protein
MIKTSLNEDNIETNEVICPPDPERIVEGLRDTGYNFNTAIADIIDNSIAAKATSVDIRIDMDPTGEITIYVADNGIGMDLAGLKNAMTYGSKVRADLGSLGKFGLGLKTASTAFCRSLSVISRGADSVIRKAEWDLDYVAKVHEWKLKMPEVDEDERDLLLQTAGEGTGTLVVWRKVDRLLKSYSNIGNRRAALKRRIEDLQFHVAMVYQRFLDAKDTRADNVKITINGTNIMAWDPFLQSEELTELLEEEEVPVEIDIPGTPESSVVIRAFLLPNANSFSTQKAKKEARISNDMQGFYVYRENRLIHYGDWLGLFINEPHGSLLRVEFSFDHNLDTAFNVDIKKSRILPAEEILDYLSKFITPARRAADERYRKGTSANVSKQAEQRDAHAESNRNIEEKAKSVEGAKITVTKPDEVRIENQNGVFQHKIAIISNPKPGQVRVIPKPDLEYGQLWEPCIADGKHAVQINQSHPYYQKVYYPVLAQNVMVTGMDALLWALAEAEHKTYNEEVKEQYEEMRIAVSRILKTLVADLPDPEEEDEE